MSERSTINIHLPIVTKPVTELLEQFPGLLYASGAHGFSVLCHAKKGGDESKTLYDHLLSLGLKDLKFQL